MYYDLLAKIKNAQMAKKESFQTSFSEVDLAVARLLAEKGYLKSAEKKNVGKKRVLEVKLCYKNGRGAINNFKIISKPGRRIYIGYRDIRKVKQGYGLGVLSTPLGVMTEQAARKNKVGGEYLFEIW
jgi:small subunit ribosomal protein S8